MSDLRYLENVIPSNLCSRSQFKEQCDKVAAMLRAASERNGASGNVPQIADRTEYPREPEIEKILQRVIVRAKGMVSEEMLVRHQREIPVDEIPDYAVTHLLVELGEQEAQSFLR
ncbi:MAG: hypothetical protein VW519_06230 [Luminiphilus sp.]|jgi:hypothetical protein